jgi:hypothetical protein
MYRFKTIEEFTVEYPVNDDGDIECPGYFSSEMYPLAGVEVTKRFYESVYYEHKEIYAADLISSDRYALNCAENNWTISHFMLKEEEDITLEF